MGEGVYVFKTRGDQDNQIFDQLDTFVMEAAGLCQVSCDRRFFCVFLLQYLSRILDDPRFACVVEREAARCVFRRTHITTRSRVFRFVYCLAVTLRSCRCRKWNLPACV